MILRGVGLGFIFVPLTGAAVADLGRTISRRGPGLFNLSRQLGGSLGIAVTATLLTRFTEQSREALLPHLSASSPAAVDWLERRRRAGLLEPGGSLPAAQQQAHALLEATLQQQASMVAFEKVLPHDGRRLRRGAPAAAVVSDGAGAGRGVGALGGRAGGRAGGRTIEERTERGMPRG